MGILSVLEKIVGKSVDAVYYLNEETSKQKKIFLEKKANEASEYELKKMLKNGNLSNAEKRLLVQIYKRRFG